jgi:hypothetical protein
LGISGNLGAVINLKKYHAEKERSIEYSRMLIQIANFIVFISI